MFRLLLMFAASVVVAAGLIISLLPGQGFSSKQEVEQEFSPVAETNAIHVYCAASNRGVMELIATDYEREYSQAIDFQFGPSQTLLSSLEVTETGDLYLPADASYLNAAASRNLLKERVPVARMHVVLAVPKGNPKQIRSFPDLLRPEIRVIQANPETAAVGKLTRDALQREQKWDQLSTHTEAFVSSVTEVANSVKVGGQMSELFTTRS